MTVEEKKENVEWKWEKTRVDDLVDQMWNAQNEKNGTGKKCIIYQITTKTISAETNAQKNEPYK